MKKMETIDLKSFLQPYRKIALTEMGQIRLMNRLDTKFITTRQVVAKLLQAAANDYRVQVVNNEEIIDYRTIYLDTIDHAMYLAHHNGRKVREKIRVRTYISSKLTFLEVKDKDNHGRTQKKRIPINDAADIHNTDSELFLQHYARYRDSELEPQIMNNFRRITLVDNNKTERLTIDIDINFFNLENGNNTSLGELAIVELKRDGRKESTFANLLHQLHVRPSNISKYCVGMSITDQELKHNRFKSLLIKINELNNN